MHTYIYKNLKFREIKELVQGHRPSNGVSGIGTEESKMASIIFSPEGRDFLCFSVSVSLLLLPAPSITYRITYLLDKS